MSVRLVEALDEYRKKGLPLARYLRCRNFALRNFIPDFGYMLLRPGISGLAYVRPVPLVLRNCVYPNFYLSLFYFTARRVRRAFKRLLA